MIRAIGERVVVERIELSEPQKGVLILERKRENVTARVVAMSDDSAVRLGDIVYIQENAGVEVEISGQKYLSLHENQILAVWRDE
jgi:co-chaperonin GroES (HSP10)